MQNIGSVFSPGDWNANLPGPFSLMKSVDEKKKEKSDLFQEMSSDLDDTVFLILCHRILKLLNHHFNGGDLIVLRRVQL